METSEKESHKSSSLTVLDKERRTADNLLCSKCLTEIHPDLFSAAKRELTTAKSHLSRRVLSDLEVTSRPSAGSVPAHEWKRYQWTASLDCNCATSYGYSATRYLPLTGQSLVPSYFLYRCLYVGDLGSNPKRTSSEDISVNLISQMV